MNPQPAPQGHTPLVMDREGAFLYVLTDNRSPFRSKLEKINLFSAQVTADNPGSINHAHNAADGFAREIQDAYNSHAHLLSESARQSQRIAELEGALGANIRLLSMVGPLLRDGPHVAKEKFIDAQIEFNRSALATSTLNQTEQGK